MKKILIILLCLPMIGFGQSWNQLGNDIDGEAAGDESGWSVSLSSDGFTIAIGSYRNDGNGSNAGHVRIFNFDGNSWVQVGNAIDGEGSYDYSGISVALSEDASTIAIGSYGNDGNGTDAGHVRIFNFNGNSWNQLGNNIDGEAANDNSGYSVSLSSDGFTVAIGAPGNDGNGTAAGHVRIYEWNGTSWTQLGNDIDGEASIDNSGKSVSLSSDGSTVAIGAIGNNGNGSNSGHVRIYSFNGNTWFQLGDDINGEASNDYSGGSVSLSSDGSIVAIGASENDGNGLNSGHVRIFYYDSTSWVQLGNDINGESPDDYSGGSVSLSSDGFTVAIGAYLNDGNGTSSGHVRIYNWNGTSWSQLGNDVDGAAYELSGISVSLSSDGSTVAIGAPYNDGNGSNSGCVRAYIITAGCIDSTACNYDPSATIDDGSCILPDGCTDSLACNYDASATCDDGSCLTNYGCIYPNACNYDPSATCDDGSCILPDGCTDVFACNYNPAANCDDGSCILPNGCTDPNACNYNSFATCDNGSCTYAAQYYDCNNVCLNDADGDGVCDELEIAGCTDPIACNYDALNTDDDGSCTYAAQYYDCNNVCLNDVDGDGVCDELEIAGCTNPNACNYNPLATDPDGSCFTTYGCTDLTACNYDPSAGCDDGSCNYLFGCTDPLYQEYDVNVLCDDGSCFLLIVIGCMDATACNYDATANVDDGSCFLPDGCTDPFACNYDASAVCDDGSCSGNIGCTDPMACNYDSWYTCDDGSCSYPGCTYPFACNYDPLAGCEDFSCALPDGCTDPTACNYDLYALCNDGSCYGISGCTDPSACNYDPSANCDDGSCYGNLGCTQPLACNYDAAATCDDGSCYGLLGCTDPLACNYDAAATCDDGSCTYPGCTYSFACNYDPLATCDDGTCYGNPGCTDASACNYEPWASCDDGSCLTAYGCTDPSACNYDASATCEDYSCLTAYGCTDPSADNYDLYALCNDGSCIYSGTCSESAPTGLFVSDIVHTRATINWYNMNFTTCVVDQYRIRYRELGTSSWSTKTMGAPVGSCTFGSQKTDKLLLNLTASTTYEYQMKAWYCGGGASSWTATNQFTTLDDCPNVGNLTAFGATPTKATLTWDASNGVYAFVRMKARVDSISNPTGSDFFQIGGTGVNYGTNTKDKNNLVPGETYRGQARTYCDPNGGAWKSVSWTPLVTWTQPTVRLEGGEAIKNLDIYPNPSRDIFNITFTSEHVQDLRVRVLNVVGEDIILEDLQQFIGEYIKQINLKDNAKGIYFLEIETNDGVINKKLILQ